MEQITQKTASPEEIIAALRRAIEASGGHRVSLQRFIDESGIPAADVFLHYAYWEDVAKAAGFNFKASNRFVEGERLLHDWGIVTRRLQRLPSKSEYDRNGKHNSTTTARHFGSWTLVPQAFLRFAKGKPEWAELEAFVSKLIEQKRSANEITYASMHRAENRKPNACHRSRNANDLKNRVQNSTIYGDPLEFGAMRNAPVNEAGVLFLFALMAERLGFMIELVRSKFPDCEARRKIGVNEWRTVRIEFEYESRNFRDHRHDPKGCDLIVCWEDNWEECPVEVLALKEEMEGMEARPKP